MAIVVNKRVKTNFRLKNLMSGSLNHRDTKTQRHKEIHKVHRLSLHSSSIFFQRLQTLTEGFEGKQGALETGGFDFALEGGDEAEVGDGCDFFDLSAED
jgi:hypothetical protein